MADRDERPFRVHALDLAGDGIPEVDGDQGFGRATGDEAGDFAVPADMDVRMPEQPILQDLLGTQRITAVDQGHVVAVVGHVERFLDRGVAAADHHHFLAPVEEAVAGRAGAHALALHMLLGRDIEPARLGAGRDHQGIAKIDGAAVALEPERPLGEVHLRNMVPFHLRADMLGLLLHLLHQPGPLDDVGEAGVILDIGGDGELAAGLDALDNDRREAGAGGVDGGGQPGGAGAEDDHAGGVRCGHDRDVRRSLPPRNAAFASIHSH